MDTKGKSQKLCAATAIHVWMTAHDPLAQKVMPRTRLMVCIKHVITEDFV